MKKIFIVQYPVWFWFWRNATVTESLELAQKNAMAIVVRYGKCRVLVREQIGWVW